MSLSDQVDDLAGRVATEFNSVRSEVVAKGELVINVRDHGMVGDGVELTDISISSGSNQIMAPNYTFTSSDVGRAIAILGAGSSGGGLSSAPSGNIRTIVSIVSDHVATFGDPLNGTALTTVAGPRSCTASITRGTNVLTSADAAFTVSDVGKLISIPGMTGDDEPVTRSIWANTTAGSTTLTLTYAGFTAQDVGAFVRITGAGASGGRHIAQITAVASGTSATIDTSAVTTATAAELTILGVPRTVQVKIVSYTNATTVVVQRMADFTVTAATAAITGGTAVIGTNNSTALSTLLSAVPANAVLYHPPGIYLLAAGSAVISKPVTFLGDSPTSAIYHVGVTAGRFTAGSDNVTWRNIGVTSLAVLSSAVFATSVSVAYAYWRFENVRFTNTALVLSSPAQVTSTGTITATGTGICVAPSLDRVEVAGVLSTGLTVAGKVYAAICRDVYVHDVGVSSASVGIKVSAGARAQFHRNRISRSIGDAMDVYDGYEVELIDCRHILNGISGLESKWSTTANYNSPMRFRIAGGSFSHNWGNGITTGAPRTLVSNVLCCGNGATGLKCTDGISGNTVGPTDGRYVSIEASGNGAEGVLVSALCSGHKFIGIVANGNGTYGVSNTGGSHVFESVSAFGNPSHGIYQGSTATKVRVTGCRSDDPNGQAYLHPSATFILINGYGEEAAGTGNPPTAASWPVGAVVVNTSDSTKWRRNFTTFVAA